MVSFAGSTSPYKPCFKVAVGSWLIAVVTRPNGPTCGAIWSCDHGDKPRSDGHFETGFVWGCGTRKGHHAACVESLLPEAGSVCTRSGSAREARTALRWSPREEDLPDE